MSQTTILVADQNDNILETLSHSLSREGYSVYTCREGEQAWRMLSSLAIDMVLIEINLPQKNGMELLREIKRHWPDLPVLMMTGRGSIRNAVQAMKLGALDYLIKPVSKIEVLKLLRQALAEQPPSRESEQTTSDLDNFDGLQGLVGNSPPIRRVFSMVQKVAGYNSNVLVTGETGTGKELVARGVHFSRLQQRGPLVTIDCAAIPESLLESELFGYAKGAFTGADRNKPGRIEQAHGGTLFLDEVGELPLSLQKKLLRFLQERTFLRVGGTRQRRVDLRIVAATNKDLEAEIAQGNWRQDLYYRLDVIRIEMPPLREHKEDIPQLADFFLAKHASWCNTQVKEVTREAMNLLLDYDWPGNVRELENVLEQAVVMAEGQSVTPACLPQRLREKEEEPEETVENLPDTELRLLRNALDKTQGNKSAAARQLGISRKRLRTLMSRHGLLNNRATRAG